MSHFHNEGHISSKWQSWGVYQALFPSTNLGTLNIVILKSIFIFNYKYNIRLNKYTSIQKMIYIDNKLITIEMIQCPQYFFKLSL